MIIKMKFLYSLFATVLTFITPLSSQNINEFAVPSEKVERMQWWSEARFGMFIHWGLYALPARHEWVMSNEQISKKDYKKYVEFFNPDLYDPSEWASLAKKAGMKYVVFTAKHHDGFSMYDTNYSDYKVTNAPIARDLLKELIEAFRAEGIRIGLYYSLIDWHHPDFLVNEHIHPERNNQQEIENDKNRDKKKFQRFLMNQITELMTNYGQIDVLFADFSYPHKKNGKGKSYWDSEALYKQIRKLQPNIILNDRMDLEEEGGWDYKSPEQFMPKNWVTFEGRKVPWETCQTFSGSWGYHRDQYTWKSPKQTIVMLIETVSKGGNLLLNVGPTARGIIQDEAVERLEATHEWMKYNSRSIYGCTAAPDDIKAPDNCLLTYNPKTNRLYVHVLNWPFKTIYLPNLAGKVKYAQILKDASELKMGTKKGAWMDDVKKNDKGITLNIPVRKPNTEIPVIELFLE